VTYDGSLTPPTAPGSYAVVATIDDPSYTGSGTGTLIIATTIAVRYAPVLDGTVEGSVEVLLPVRVNLRGTASISTDLLVPGTPRVQVGPRATYGGTLDGDGSATPSQHTILVSGLSSLRHVVRRTDAVPFPTLTAPRYPIGTRRVILTASNRSPGDFSTIRNLTLRGNTGLVAVPPGTYGNFVTGGGGGFILGVPGATVPSVYSFQLLTLNGPTDLQIVGPVIVKVRGTVTLAGAVGDPAHPDWLEIQVPNASVLVKAAATMNGFVVAPAGTVTVAGALRGGVISSRLVLPLGGSLQDQ
jgi:rhamnogalacturonan endolyase